MSHLLLEVHANKLKNHALFAHKLFLYDDKMVFKTRNLIRVQEVTISYNHVSQVFLSRGIFFGSLEIINTGGVKDIIVKHVPKKQAAQAKKIIDKKIHQVHAQPDRQKEGKSTLNSIEKSLSRLKELLQKDKISNREYSKRRKKILETLK